jgi:predicted acetyltransferase
MASFRASIVEFMAHSVEDFSYPTMERKRDERAYLKRCEDFRKGKVPENFVPSSTFWLVDGRHFLGIGNVRHYLNDNLRRFGGHIGYAIRPAAWQKGLGTLQLTLLLQEARKLGIEKVTITCFDENIGSIKIIERNGGVLLTKINNKFKDKERLTRIYQIQ